MSPYSFPTYHGFSNGLNAKLFERSFDFVTTPPSETYSMEVDTSILWTDIPAEDIAFFNEPPTIDCNAAGIYTNKAVPADFCKGSSDSSSCVMDTFSSDSSSLSTNFRPLETTESGCNGGLNYVVSSSPTEMIEVDVAAFRIIQAYDLINVYLYIYQNDEFFEDLSTFDGFYILLEINTWSTKQYINVLDNNAKITVNHNVCGREIISFDTRSYNLPILEPIEISWVATIARYCDLNAAECAEASFVHYPHFDSSYRPSEGKERCDVVTIEPFQDVGLTSPYSDLTDPQV